VDSFKTELIADRVWRTRSQLELAVVEYVGWFNNARLHESLGDIPPAEYEQRWHALTAACAQNPDDQPVAPPAARAAEARTARRLLAAHEETAGNGADHLPPGADRGCRRRPQRPAERPPTRRTRRPLAPLALRARSARGGGEHDPEGATTLTIESTRPNRNGPRQTRSGSTRWATLSRAVCLPLEVVAPAAG